MQNGTKSVLLFFNGIEKHTDRSVSIFMPLHDLLFMSNVNEALNLAKRNYEQTRKSTCRHEWWH